MLLSLVVGCRPELVAGMAGGDTGDSVGAGDSGAVDSGAVDSGAVDDTASSEDSGEFDSARRPNLYTGIPLDPSDGVWLYAPQLAGCSLVLTWSDSPSFHEAWDFDTRGRATSRAAYDDDGVVSNDIFTWDAADCVTSNTSTYGGVTVTMTAKCDAMGNPVEQRWVIDDTSGHRVDVTRASYEYDDDDRPVAAWTQYNDEEPWVSTYQWAGDWITDRVSVPETPSASTYGWRFYGSARDDGRIVEMHQQLCVDGDPDACYDMLVSNYDYVEDGSILDYEKAAYGLSVRADGTVSQTESTRARWVPTYGADLRRPLEVNVVEGEWYGTDSASFDLECL